MRKSNAFTLIELLVVIAIIAILAAILFPVFAQAKAAAKKTQALSNTKQISLGILQYMGDVDDLGPLGMIKYGNSWSDGFSGWQYPSNPDQGNSDGLIWGNSTYPYIKSTDISKDPGTVGVYNPYGAKTSGPGSSFTYNGDLQSSSSTAVVAPATTVLIWSGFLNTTWVNRSWANPRLNCSSDGNAACVYQSGGSGNGSADNLTVYSNLAGANYSKWIHGQGSNFAYIDGHAKFRSLKGDYTADPFASGNQNGIVTSTSTGGGYSVWVNNGHTCLFGLDNPCGL